METIKQAKNTAADLVRTAKEKVMEIAERVTEKVMGRDPAQADVLTLLKQDHKLIASLFEQTEASTKRTDPIVKGLFAQLKDEMETHASVEEKIFYPALQQAEPFLMREAFKEHSTMKQLLAEMAAMPIGDKKWTEKLSLLKQSVERHVAEEESVIFKIARKNMNELQLREMGGAMEREKRMMTAEGDISKN